MACGAGNSRPDFSLALSAAKSRATTGSTPSWSKEFRRRSPGMTGCSRIPTAPHFGRDIKNGAHARRVGLLKRPRLLRREIAVRGGDHRPDVSIALWIACGPWPFAGKATWPRLRASAVGIGEMPGRGSAFAVLGDHRQRALRQIAEVVRQIRVDAVDDGLVGETAVLAERHLAQEEIADLVRAVVADQQTARPRCPPTSTSSRPCCTGSRGRTLAPAAGFRRTSGRPANRPRGSA